MKKIFVTCVSFLLLATPLTAFCNISKNTVSSPTIVSQNARFVIRDQTPWYLDRDKSLALNNFIAFQNISDSKNEIFVGPIIEKGTLKQLCENPTFLKDEQIVASYAIPQQGIQYFNHQEYKGCLAALGKNKTLLIVERPKPFVGTFGSRIEKVGVIGNTKQILLMKDNLSFSIIAKDFFDSLLQLGQAFSPFSEAIDWNKIQQQGTVFIDKQTKTCQGLLAFDDFAVPALHKYDLHSLVLISQANTNLCPKAPIVKDETLKKWLAIPQEKRRPVIKYMTRFHGERLNQQIAYVYIPSINAFAPESVNLNIKKGREALAKAHLKESCGLIIDLRFNTGGNLQSMLLTLGGVIPSGKLFNLGKDSPVYLSKDGNKLFFSTENIYGQYQGSAPNINRNKPIAILTNEATASSGAITSLVLRDNGAPRKVFGTNTSSTVSINTTFDLFDGNVLNLMIERIYNKNNQIAPLSLSVDEPMQARIEDIFQPKKDPVINAAKNWLESLSVCSNRF